MPLKWGFMIQNPVVLAKMKNFKIFLIWVSFEPAWNLESKTIYRIEKYRNLTELGQKNTFLSTYKEI